MVVIIWVNQDRQKMRSFQYAVSSVECHPLTQHATLPMYKVLIDASRGKVRGISFDVVSRTLKSTH